VLKGKAAIFALLRFKT